MIRIPVKKIWYGDKTLGHAKITLRSYWVTDAIKRGESIAVEYEGLTMTLSPRKLNNPVGRRLFKSKIGSSDYELLDYKWSPDNNEND